jgi:hypothetical protein
MKNPIVSLATLLLSVGCATTSTTTTPALSKAVSAQLAATGTSIGQTLKQQAQQDGDSLMTAVVPIALNSVAPSLGTTPAGVQTVANSISQTVTAYTASGKVTTPSAVAAAASLANAFAQANPTTTNQQIAAIATLSAAVSSVLYPSN